METQFTEFASGFRLFVFGSALWSPNPNDIDILGVYDPQIVPAAAAHKRIQPFAEWLATQTGLQVDVTLLSEREVARSKFIETERCVEFADCDLRQMVDELASGKCPNDALASPSTQLGVVEPSSFSKQVLRYHRVSFQSRGAVNSQLV